MFQCMYMFLNYQEFCMLFLINSEFATRNSFSVVNVYYGIQNFPFCRASFLLADSACSAATRTLGGSSSTGFRSLISGQQCIKLPESRDHGNGQ